MRSTFTRIVHSGHLIGRLSASLFRIPESGKSTLQEKVRLVKKMCFITLKFITMKNIENWQKACLTVSNWNMAVCLKWENLLLNKKPCPQENPASSPYENWVDNRTKICRLGKIRFRWTNIGLTVCTCWPIVIDSNWIASCTDIHSSLCY